MTPRNLVRKARTSGTRTVADMTTATDGASARRRPAAEPSVRLLVRRCDFGQQGEILLNLTRGAWLSVQAGANGFTPTGTVPLRHWPDETVEELTAHLADLGSMNQLVQTEHTRARREIVHWRKAGQSFKVRANTRHAIDSARRSGLLLAAWAEPDPDTRAVAVTMARSTFRGSAAKLAAVARTATHAGTT